MFKRKHSTESEGHFLQWTWQEYYRRREELEQEGAQVILVDMIGQPVLDATPLSESLFQSKHPEGTYFALYCNSGATSGRLQQELMQQLPQYNIVNISGGIGLFEAEVRAQ